MQSCFIAGIVKHLGLKDEKLTFSKPAEYPNEQKRTKLTAEFNKLKELNYPTVKTMMLNRFRRLRFELKSGKEINISDK